MRQPPAEPPRALAQRPVAMRCQAAYFGHQVNYSDTSNNSACCRPSHPTENPLLGARPQWGVSRPTRPQPERTEVGFYEIARPGKRAAHDLRYGRLIGPGRARIIQRYTAPGAASTGAVRSAKQRECGSEGEAASSSSQDRGCVRCGPSPPRTVGDCIPKPHREPPTACPLADQSGGNVCSCQTNQPGSARDAATLVWPCHPSTEWQPPA